MYKRLELGSTYRPAVMATVLMSSNRETNVNAKPLGRVLTAEWTIEY